MALHPEHFVGRAEELEFARPSPGRARAGSSARDPAGRRAGHREDAAAGRARGPRGRRGHLVLSGSASELERDLPFSVFVDALDEYVRGIDR